MKFTYKDIQVAVDAYYDGKTQMVSDAMCKAIHAALASRASRKAAKREAKRKDALEESAVTFAEELSKHVEAKRKCDELAPGASLKEIQTLCKNVGVTFSPYTSEPTTVRVMPKPAWDGKFGVGAWRMRNGDRDYVSQFREGEPYPLKTANGRSWSIDGRYKWNREDSPFDLIAPWDEQNSPKA